MLSMSDPLLSVIMPTFDRPENLVRAVRSLFSQTCLRRMGFTLILVDNTPGHTAMASIKALRSECPDMITLISLHEPNPGVANARNAAMRAAKTDLIAFLDDDQTAPPDWLEALLEAYAQCQAIATFGPVITKLPDPDCLHADYFRHFFARDPGHDSGYIDEYYGCGNALIDFAQIPGGPPWFDTKMNETGGEDDMLFRRIKPLGKSYAWAGDAHVFEQPLESRLNLHYTLRRAFSYGQGPVTLAYLASPRRYLSMLYWICVGCVKTPLYAGLWCLLFLARKPGHVTALDQMFRGLGKIIWFIDVQSYGQSALDKKLPRFTLRAHGSRPGP